VYRVFAADPSDIDWMFTNFCDAAAKGHFAQDTSLPDVRDGVRVNLMSIITHGIMLDSKLRAQAMVYEHKGTRVGFAVMSELEAGAGGNQIHLFVVDPAFRSKGHGQAMVSDIVNRWHPLTDLYASCFPASRIMARLLIKNGFVQEGASTSPLTLVLRKEYRNQSVAV